MTLAGAKILQEELRQLATIERPKTVREVAEAAAQGDRSENAEYIYGKKRLREIDRRLNFLTKRLDESAIVDPSENRENVNQVFFGATIRLCDEDEKVVLYQLVGSDEADTITGKISYQCPLGKALMKRKVGDVVTFERPAGNAEFEILEILYI